MVSWIIYIWNTIEFELNFYEIRWLLQDCLSEMWQIFKKLKVSTTSTSPIWGIADRNISWHNICAWNDFRKHQKFHLLLRFLILDLISKQSRKWEQQCAEGNCKTDRSIRLRSSFLTSSQFVMPLRALHCKYILFERSLVRCEFTST